MWALSPWYPARSPRISLPTLLSSEQIPTACAPGRAGGRGSEPCTAPVDTCIQLLPGADDAAIYRHRAGYPPG
ncbi:MAG: hypothetical protein ACLRWQ_02340 [Flavonifractor plautii]